METKPDWTRCRVLLVDRDGPFRFRVRRLLRGLNVAELLSATTAVVARDLVRRVPLDIVVLELAEDGAMDFLRWVRQSSAVADLPILVTVDDEAAPLVMPARKAGVEGVLAKPASAEQVARAVAAVLANPVRMPAGDVSAPEAATPRHARPRKQAKGAIAPACGAEPKKPSSGCVEGLAPVGLPAVSGDGDWGGPEAPAAEPAKGGDPFPPPLPGESSGAAPESIEPKLTPEAKPEPEPSSAPNAEESLARILADHSVWIESSSQRGQRANLAGKDHAGAALEGAFLANALLAEVDLSSANLSGAQLQGADLRRASLQGANLAGCNLAVAKLRHARMAGCRLEGANLKGADLAGANFDGARFGAADLKGAILLGTRFKGADLSQVAGLTKSQLAAAEVDSATKLPPGFG